MTIQKEILEQDTKVVIYSEKTKELTKEVFIYLQDLNGDGELFSMLTMKLNIKMAHLRTGMGWNPSTLF